MPFDKCKEKNKLNCFSKFDKYYLRVAFPKIVKFKVCSEITKLHDLNFEILTTIFAYNCIYFSLLNVNAKNVLTRISTKTHQSNF